jgi:hypothetical protein
MCICVYDHVHTYPFIFICNWLFISSISAGVFLLWLILLMTYIDKCWLYLCQRFRIWANDDDDVYLYKLQTRGVKKSAPYVSI